MVRCLHEAIVGIETEGLGIEAPALADRPIVDVNTSVSRIMKGA
jgi:hypothetical protein